MDSLSFERFAADFARLGADPDDRAVDRLITKYFQIDIALAPDIIRNGARRLARCRPAQALWEALRSVERDVVALDAENRALHPLGR
jgi:hypothetical protein